MTIEQDDATFDYRLTEPTFQLSNFSYADGISLLVSCTAVYTIYTVAAARLSSVKSKAWIIMCLSSGVLSLFGLYALSVTVQSNAWSFRELYCDDDLARLVMIFFMSANIMDLALGFIHYPKFLDPLSTITHHIFYILLVFILLGVGFTKGFVLVFVMEMPTFLLSMGSISNEYRHDLLFGVVFFFTRLLYNAYFGYKVALISYDWICWKIGVLTFSVHLYWFSKWMKNYTKYRDKARLGHNFLQKEKSC